MFPHSVKVSQRSVKNIHLLLTNPVLLYGTNSLRVPVQLLAQSVKWLFLFLNIRVKSFPQLKTFDQLLKIFSLSLYHLPSI